MVPDNLDSKKKSNKSRSTNTELFNQFKKNLKEFFDHLDANSVENLLDDLEDIIPETPIHPLWQDHIQGCFEKWVMSVPDPRFIPIVVNNWSWMKNPNNSIWEAINTIASFGAGSVKQLVEKYSIIIQDKGMQRPTGKKRDMVKKRFREAFRYLVSCGIIGKKTLEEEELGHSRFTVDIYYAPEHLRLPLVLDDAIQQYTRGGGRSTGKKPKEVGIKEKSTKREKKLEKEIEKQMTDDKDTHYACTHCRTSVKVPKQRFTAYHKTNDEKTLITAFYGKVPSYKFGKIERANTFRPCSCLNNKWVRLTHYGEADTHKEILTLENGQTEKAKIIVEKISNDEFFEFITSEKFGNPMLAGELKLLEGTKREEKEK